MDNYIDVIFVWSGGILQILFWSVLEICGGTFRIRRLASCTFINFHLASLREVKHINGNNTIWDFFFSPLVAGHWVCSNGNHRQQLKPTHESRPSLPTLRVLWFCESVCSSYPRANGVRWIYLLCSISVLVTEVGEHQGNDVELSGGNSLI